MKGNKPEVKREGKGFKKTPQGGSPKRVYREKEKVSLLKRGSLRLGEHLDKTE